MERWYLGILWLDKHGWAAILFSEPQPCSFHKSIEKSSGEDFSYILFPWTSPLLWYSCSIQALPFLHLCYSLLVSYASTYVSLIKFTLKLRVVHDFISLTSSDKNLKGNDLMWLSWILSFEDPRFLQNIPFFFNDTLYFYIHVPTYLKALTFNINILL